MYTNLVGRFTAKRMWLLQLAPMFLKSMSSYEHYVEGETLLMLQIFWHVSVSIYCPHKSLKPALAIIALKQHAST